GRADSRRGSETVLLAEDEPAVRELVVATLKAVGYRVESAANADEAVRLAARHDGPIHLLLTDVVMPGASGRALAESLTATFPSLKVLYMSGDTEVLTREVREAGVPFLAKPFSPDQLARKVREVLDTA